MTRLDKGFIVSLVTIALIFVFGILSYAAQIPIVEPIEEAVVFEETVPETVVEETAAPKLTSLGTFTITAYCGCAKCNGKWAKYNKTASGTTPRSKHTIATNKKDFSFGTVLVINGIEYVVEDRGVGPGKIDIFYDSHKEALNFGRQKLEVFLKEAD